MSPTPAYPIPTGNTERDVTNILAYLQNLFLNQPQAVTAGMILLWPSTSVAPAGFLIMSGQTLVRANYPQLWNLPSNGFGTGNGTTTFTLQNPTPPSGMGYIIKT